MHGTMQKFDSKKKSETRGKKWTSVRSRIRGTKIPTWVEKMDTSPIVELGVLGAHLKKEKKRERLKKERKNDSHGPSNKQYASKRWQTFQKGQRSWSRSMTFLSLAPSIDIAKFKVSIVDGP